MKRSHHQHFDQRRKSPFSNLNSLKQNKSVLILIFTIGDATEEDYDSAQVFAAALQIPLCELSSRFCPRDPAGIFQSFFFPCVMQKKREVKNHIKRISLFVLMRLLEWHRSVWDCFTSSPAREPICRGEWFRSNQADDELISDFFRAIAVNAGEYIAGIFNFPLRVKLHFEA